jgi:hypothetical protein
MNRGVLKALTLGAGVFILGVGGCKKKSLDDVDLAYHHSPEGVHEKIQEQKSVLTDALARHELVFIHDQAYYVQGLVDALTAKLEGEKKERLAPLFAEISHRIDKVHDAAGSGKEGATELKLQELFEALKQLEPEFKPGKKK